MQQLDMFAKDEDPPPILTIPEAVRQKVVHATAQLLVEIVLPASEGEERGGDDGQDS